MGRDAQAFGDVIGDTVADALNALYREAQFLERVGGFLKSLGDLAPPCAALPYVEQRDRLIALATKLRATLVPTAGPSIREAVTRALDAVETKLNATPVITQAWIDAPEQWKAGAYELAHGVVTRALGWVAGYSGMSWSEVQSVGRTLLDAGTFAWLITLNPTGAVIAAVTYRGDMWADLERVLKLTPVDAIGELKSALQNTIAEAVKFETRFKPSIYQQVLGVWLLARTSASPDVMKVAMANMNPYTLPTMPEAWDGSFRHMRQGSGGESGAWLIALLLGSFLGLSIAALTAE